jgi:hypothetical protein
MAAGVASAADAPPAIGTQPARVSNARPEADLTKVELSAEAETRLGVRLAVIEQRPLQRTRVLGGEVLVAVPPTGDAKALVMQAPSDPVQAAKELVVAENEVRAGAVQVETASLELKRAQQVLAGGAGSARAVDEAKAKLATARIVLETGQQRRDMLTAATRQTAAALWVRVPIYAGDVAALAEGAPANVSRLGNQAEGASITAQPVTGPASANPAAATLDLFFALSHNAIALRPGEKVDVALRLRDAERATVVPWSAVLHDVHGNEWIYEQTAPHTFVRRRVQIRFVTDGVAALASGPPAGTRVVTDGAAELFSTELGVGK